MFAQSVVLLVDPPLPEDLLHQVLPLLLQFGEQEVLVVVGGFEMQSALVVAEALVEESLIVAKPEYFLDGQAEVGRREQQKEQGGSPDLVPDLPVEEHLADHPEQERELQQVDGGVDQPARHLAPHCRSPHQVVLIHPVVGRQPEALEHSPRRHQRQVEECQPHYLQHFGVPLPDQVGGLLHQLVGLILGHGLLVEVPPSPEFSEEVDGIDQPEQ